MEPETGGKFNGTTALFLPCCGLCCAATKRESMMKRMILAVAAATLMAASAQAGTTTGMASYYKSGKLTANGERFNPHGLTAAHRTLPFGTKVKVTNLRNGRSVIVRINDRGPFIRGRVMDLSLGAAQQVGLTATGVTRIAFTVMK